MDTRNEINLLSDVIEAMASAENLTEVNKLANHLIKAINHARNSEIYNRENDINHFKEVQIRPIDEENVHTGWLISAIKACKDKTVNLRHSGSDLIKLNLSDALSTNFEDH